MWVNKTLKPRGRRHACGFTLSTSSPDTLVRVFDAETLTQVHVSFLYRIIMPLPAESLLFAVQMALRKALKMVPGLRKQIGERDERVMVIKFVNEIGIAYGIVKKPGDVGHLFDPLTGPEMKEPGR